MLANSRFTVAVSGFFPNSTGRRYGVMVESLGDTPAEIVVERAMYWDSVDPSGRRVPWAAGTDALGTRVK